jgi:hypothetical protein
MVAIGKSGWQAILNICPSICRAEIITATAPRRQWKCAKSFEKAIRSGFHASGKQSQVLLPASRA